MSENSMPRPVRVVTNFPPAQTHAPKHLEDSNDSEKSSETSAFHTIIAVAKWLAKSMIWFVVLTGAIYYFFGGSRIEATLDDKPVKAQVWINGDYIGMTPYTTRLPFGKTKIEVLQPDGVDTNESQWTIVTIGWHNIRSTMLADFTTIEE